MKPIVFHTVCWRSKERVLFFRPLIISRNIWLKGPFCRSQSSVIACDKRVLAGRLQDYPQDNPPGQSILQSSTLAYWILSGIDPGTNNDLNCHRVPVPSGDRHLGQWASPPPLFGYLRKENQEFWGFQLPFSDSVDMRPDRCAPTQVRLPKLQQDMLENLLKELSEGP